MLWYSLSYSEYKDRFSFFRVLEWCRTFNICITFYWVLTTGTTINTTKYYTRKTWIDLILELVD